MPKSVDEICRALLQDDLLVANAGTFIQAVGRAFGLDHALNGTANTIRGRFSTPAIVTFPFNYIGPDPGLATWHADRGLLVLGGVTSEEMVDIGPSGHPHRASMGHIVVIAPGGPSRPGLVTLNDGSTRTAPGGYPYCYHGTSYYAFRCRERTQVDVVFPRDRLHKLVYCWMTLPPQPPEEEAPAEQAAGSAPGAAAPAGGGSVAGGAPESGGSPPGN